jgi:hypothetical protein
MYKKNYEAPSVPTAMIAVNKSRLKVYNNTGDMPTYYLQKGQEFQIELFNPTTDVILAKIILNGNAISQGGLVLNPGQRVFLDRYLDVAKKFLFDTYEVSNSEEVKKAIENNGDLKVEFYKERIPNYFTNNGNITLCGGTNINRGFSGTLNNTTIGGYVPNGDATFTNTSGHIGSTALYTSSVSNTFFDQNASNSIPTLDSMDDTLSLDMPDVTRRFSQKKLSKSIETGRVEQGSVSDQKVVTVDKKFEYWAFHTIEYKMLPVSQKINTVEDIQVKVYCTNCGAKLSKGHKFCGQCGTKA